MKNQQPQTGAEAILSFSEHTVRKERIPKPYRHPVLDERLRVARTKREASILQKAPVRVPKLVSIEKTTLTMERIDGGRLRDALNTQTVAAFGSALGSMIRTLHDADIVHGDLTTSNVLVETNSQSLVLIDFGLSLTTKRVEDKAVDLHVLRETLQGSHPLLATTFWDAFVATYAHEPNNPVLERLQKVEARGRHKASY
jgi:N6-L-threonylcarbamoyladenine synthase/protein kinase Bud32